MTEETIKETKIELIKYAESCIGEYYDYDKIANSINNRQIQLTDEQPHIKGNTIYVKPKTDSNQETSYNLQKTAILSLEYDENLDETNKENALVNEAIAGYFTSLSNFYPHTQKDYLGKTLWFLTPHSNLLETIIEQIAPIIGKDSLALSLKSGLLMIPVFINSQTHSNLGNNFYTLLKRLCELMQEAEKLNRVVDYNSKLYEKKIINILSIIQNNKTYPYTDLSINMLLKNDFNLTKTFFKDEINPNIELTEREKIIVRKYIKEYNNIEHPALERNYLLNNTCFTDFDRLNYVKVYLERQLSLSQTRLFKIWRELQELIVYKIIPEFIKKTDSYIDIDYISNLGSYSEGTETFNLKDKNKTKRLKTKYNL